MQIIFWQCRFVNLTSNPMSQIKKMCFSQTFVFSNQSKIFILRTLIFAKIYPGNDKTFRDLQWFVRYGKMPAVSCRCKNLTSSFKITFEIKILVCLLVLQNKENHCVKSVCIRSYSGPHFPACRLNKVRMRENVDQNNSEYGHFSRNERLSCLLAYEAKMACLSCKNRITN